MASEKIAAENPGVSGTGFRCDILSLPWRTATENNWQNAQQQIRISSLLQTGGRYE
jgi:hypothetical protein